MSSFSFPVLPAVEIVAFFADRGIASFSVDDLSSLTSEFVCSLYSAILSYILELSGGLDLDAQVDFAALEHLHNPDNHVESQRKSLLYRTMRSFLHEIKFGGDFPLRDLIQPEPRRTTLVLSCVVNFLLHKEEKMSVLQPLVDRFPAFEERRVEAEAKLSELDREALEYEAAREMEQPIVEQLEADIKDSKQNIHSLNKEQMSRKAHAMSLKELEQSLKDKISQADFELMKNAQENSKLMSRIVQSPEKLQRAIEEKRSLGTEEENGEKSTTLVFKERTTKLEELTKVCEKMTRQLGKLEVLQEQVNSTKALEKENKATKARLSDGELLNRSLDVQIVGVQGRVTEAEDLEKEMEKTREIKFAEHAKKVELTKMETEKQMETIKKRELDAKTMIVKGEQYLGEIDTVREARRIQEQAMLEKSEELAEEHRRYAAHLSPTLQGFASKMLDTHGDISHGR